MITRRAFDHSSLHGNFGVQSSAMRDGGDLHVVATRPQLVHGTSSKRRSAVCVVFEIDSRTRTFAGTNDPSSFVAGLTATAMWAGADVSGLAASEREDRDHVSAARRCGFQVRRRRSRRDACEEHSADCDDCHSDSHRGAEDTNCGSRGAPVARAALTPVVSLSHLARVLRSRCAEFVSADANASSRSRAIGSSTVGSTRSSNNAR